MQSDRSVQSLAATPTELTKLSTAKAIQSQRGGHLTGPRQGHLWKKRCQALWVRMQSVTDRLREVTAVQDRLDKLRLVVMAKATHKAWDNMENFVRGGAKTGLV